MNATDRDDFVQDPSRRWRMAGAEGPGKESARVNSRASGDGCAEAGRAPQPQSCSRGSDGCEIVGPHEMCGTVVRAELDPWLLLAGDVEIADEERT